MPGKQGMLRIEHNHNNTNNTTVIIIIVIILLLIIPNRLNKNRNSRNQLKFNSLCKQNRVWWLMGWHRLMVKTWRKLTLGVLFTTQLKNLLIKLAHRPIHWGETSKKIFQKIYKHHHYYVLNSCFGDFIPNINYRSHFWPRETFLIRRNVFFSGSPTSKVLNSPSLKLFFSWEIFALSFREGSSLTTPKKRPSFTILYYFFQKKTHCFS